MSLRVVGAGLGRTGTHSPKIALQRLPGAPSYHMTETFAHPEHVPLWLAAMRNEPVDWPARAQVPAARLVDWQPTDGWGPLCAALEVPEPDEPFPLTNTTEEFLKMVRGSRPDR